MRHRLLASLLTADRVVAAALVLAGLCVPAFCGQARAQGTLCDRLRALTEGPAVAEAHWGVSVLAPDGSTLCAIHDGQLFRPASTDKLLTSAAALGVLGPGFTTETRVRGRLDTATGTVVGDLVLEGGGDPNLDSGDLPYAPHAPERPHSLGGLKDLENLVAQLSAAGVRSVTGGVVGDDTLFPYQPYPAGWVVDDLAAGYAAPVSALSIADNQLRLTVTPGRLTGPAARGSDAPATVTLEDHGVPYYTVEAEVRTAGRGGQTAIGIERLSGSRVLRVYGSVAEDAPPDVEEVALDDPAAYAALALRQLLIAHGIAVAGAARSLHQPPVDAGPYLTRLVQRHGPEEAFFNGGLAGPRCAPAAEVEVPVLARHRSAPLSQDVLFTLKTSANLHAELMLRALAGRVAGGSCPDRSMLTSTLDSTLGSTLGTTLGGARVVRAFLVHAGLDPEPTVLFDGSGLSTYDQLTPRLLTGLLGYAAGMVPEGVPQPWFAEWRASLPVGGVDGTLSKRFTGELKGRVFAKTGTLGESRALAGYVVSGTGRTLAFAILDDNHTPGTTADRTAMDRMVEAIAASD